VPEVILGVSLLILFVVIGLELGYTTIVISHVTFCFPFVMASVQARLAGLDPSLEEAALDLGATPLRVFFVITLPLILPALLAAWLLAFTLSLDDVVIASFLSGPGYTTLPLEVFSRVRLGLKPEINALATLFMLIVGLFVVLANWMQWRKNARGMQ
jgi:putrescine transport system permease protein